MLKYTRRKLITVFNLTKSDAFDIETFPVSKELFYSFDIFDTSITRTLAAPQDVFSRLATIIIVERRLIGCLPNDFVGARLQAEEKARVIEGSRTVGLAQIYQQVIRQLKVAESFVPIFQELECELELTITRPIPAVSDCIARLRKEAIPIVFVSDMYHSSSFLIKLLSSHGLWVSGDSLYVSCEFGLSKAAGDLYGEIYHRHRVDGFRKWIHVGDNQFSDGLVASEYGIKPYLFLESHLNRYEKTIILHSHQTKDMVSSVMGCSRVTRIMAFSRSIEPSIATVSSSVAAPLLAGYAMWLLRRAQKKEIKRLYFLSREGQVLIMFARALADKMGIDIELRPLFGGRKAWFVPAFKQLGPKELDIIFIRTTNSLSMAGVLDRLSLQFADCAKILVELGFDKDHLDHSLTRKEIDLLRKTFVREPMRRIILERSENMRGIVRDYFIQEGLLDGVHCGVVDVGWFARMKPAMEKIMGNKSEEFPDWFYFGLGKNVDAKDQKKLNVYLFNANEENIPSVCEGIKDILEIFTAADYGTCIGYARQNDKVQPVFAESDNPAFAKWHGKGMRECFKYFLQNLTPDLKCVDESDAVKMGHAVTYGLQLFKCHPTENEARTWGSFPFEPDLVSGNNIPIAASLSFRDVFNIMFKRRRDPQYWRWPEGEWILTPHPWREIAKILMMSRKVVAKCYGQ